MSRSPLSLHSLPFPLSSSSQLSCFSYFHLFSLSLPSHHRSVLDPHLPSLVPIPSHYNFTTQVFSVVLLISSPFPIHNPDPCLRHPFSSSIDVLHLYISTIRNHALPFHSPLSPPFPVQLHRLTCIPACPLPIDHWLANNSSPFPSARSSHYFCDFSFVDTLDNQAKFTDT